MSGDVEDGSGKDVNARNGSADGRPVWRLSAGELAAAYRSGALTPSGVLEALLARIDALNPSLCSLVHLSPHARAAARASDERHRRGEAIGPLDGVPVSVKDNILTRDMPTSWGNAALAVRAGRVDEVAVARLRDAGAVLIGKTNVPEFTLEGFTSNRVFGVTRNPWDPALTPGGSSGGAVAGLAAGLFPLAIGTDGGGSIRRPASHAGLAGLKPSIGAVARVDALPPLLLDFEVVGPIARNVDDLATLFDVLRGPDPRDRRSRLALSPPRAESLRILYVPRFGDSPVDPEIAASVAAAAAALEASGHRVTHGPLPLDLSPLDRFWPAIGQSGLAALFAEDPEVGEAAAPKYREMAQQGARVGAPALLQFMQQVERLRIDCAALFARHDLVMTPAAAALPWPADVAFPPVIAGRDVGPRGHAVFTGWVNAAGLPAIALPSAPSSAGLPIGFQLVGEFGSDLQLLAVARAWEGREPWAQRWPRLAG